MPKAAPVDSQRLRRESESIWSPAFRFWSLAAGLRRAIPTSKSPTSRELAIVGEKITHFKARNDFNK
jgi:hypothetical protein